MSNIEKIKAEIERLKNIAENDNASEYLRGQARVCRVILSFIDSLPEEEPSKDLDLDKEYNDFVESDPVYSKLVNNIVGKAIARHFAEWGRMRFRDTEKSQNEMSENIGQLKKIAAQAYVAQLVLNGKAPDGLTIFPLREIAENAFIYGAEWGAKHSK